MQKEKQYKGSKFSNETIYAAYDYFIKLCDVPIEKINTTLQITKDMVTTDYDNSTEFFAKLFDADDIFIALMEDGKELWVHSHKSGNSTITVKLKKEVEIDMMINIFDGMKIKNIPSKIDDSLNSTTIDSESVDRLGQKIDNHMKKNTKIAIIGIVGGIIVTIIVGISGYIP